MLEKIKGEITLYNHYQPEVNPNDLQHFYQYDSFYRQQQPQYYQQPYHHPRPPRCRWVQECRWVRRCYPRDGFYTDGYDY
ncbi:Spore coat protein [Priestia megaterium]